MPTANCIEMPALSQLQWSTQGSPPTSMCRMLKWGVRLIESMGGMQGRGGSGGGGVNGREILAGWCRYNRQLIVKIHFAIIVIIASGVCLGIIKTLLLYTYLHNGFIAFFCHLSSFIFFLSFIRFINNYYIYYYCYTKFLIVRITAFVLSFHCCCCCFCRCCCNK